MYINVHLNKEEISKALARYVESTGFTVESQPLIQIQINKGDAREPETWNAVVCGCKQVLKDEVKNEKERS
jgi:ferredoxin-thioredoxin reductase catalytic subunit